MNSYYEVNKRTLILSKTANLSLLNLFILITKKRGVVPLSVPFVDLHQTGVGVQESGHCFLMLLLVQCFIDGQDGSVCGYFVHCLLHGVHMRLHGERCGYVGELGVRGVCMCASCSFNRLNWGALDYASNAPQLSLLQLSCTLLPSSPLAYPTDSTILLLTSYLPIKTLVSSYSKTCNL